jgi:cation:H+ antiporter
LPLSGLATSVAFFIVGAVAIWFGGSRLPETGDNLARKLGISATAVGLFVLSVITSLPELAVTLAAMLRENAPDLALGNILGSNNFNVTSIFALEMLVGGVLLHHVDRTRYVRTCSYLLSLTFIAGLGVIFGPMIRSAPVTVLLFSVPIAAIFLHDSLTHRRVQGKRRGATRESGGMAVDVVRFLLLSAVVVAGGFLIARGATGMASHEFPGGFMLGQTFVGTLLVAVATSMPEVSVAYSAVRRGGLEDMALGTLLGSNTVNILVYAVGAPFMALRFQHSAWQNISASNLVSVITALVLTVFVLLGIVSRSHRSGRTVARALVALMVPVYFVCLLLVYRAS